MSDVLDTTGMWDVTASLPEQVFDASVSEVTIPPLGVVWLVPEGQ